MATDNSDHSHEEPLDDGTIAVAWDTAVAHAEVADYLDVEAFDLIATVDPRKVAVGVRAHQAAAAHRTLAAAALAVAGLGADEEAHVELGLAWLDEAPSDAS